MPRFQTAIVEEVLEERNTLQRLTIKIGRKKRRATCFKEICGEAAKGDRVLVNTTGADLELGTGGEDFVVWNLSRDKGGKMSGGHILKLRYTPAQIDTLVAESPESPHHSKLQSATSLDGMPVVACGLHSQLAPVSAVLKHLDPDLKVAYLMTDGAALPLAHSDLVAELREKNVVDASITCGHAFGGDFEAVNIFSGLVVASEVVGADVTVVAMGPGIVGTGTALGHTAMEQGQVLSATAALGGRPVAALRISFADPRERHQCVSHHSINSLRFAALARCTIAVPDLEIDKLTRVMTDLTEAGLAEMHDIKIVDGWETSAAMDLFSLGTTTMGRDFEQDPEFFEAAGAAGLLAGQMIYELEET